MLEATGISVKVGHFLLNKVSLAVKKSHCHVILGPTGSGKTLLLESLMGLRKPDTGRVLIDGVDSTGLPIERRRLSYVPQDLALFPHLTVRDNIIYGPRVSGTRNDTNVDELVSSLGIEHILNRATHNLSGGERQRVALARALASECSYLLLDEPLSSLHESLRKELWFLLKDLLKRYGLSILMVTHDLEEAFFLGDFISVMIDGRIRQEGNKGDIYNRPDDLEVARFLGIRNLFQGELTEITGNVLTVFSDELGASVRASAMTCSNHSRPDFEVDAKVVLGVRSENMEILRRDHTAKASYNKIGGVIETILDKAASFLVTVRPHCFSACQRTLEAELPNHVFHDLRLEKGRNVTVFLHEEKVFVIPYESRR